MCFSSSIRCMQYVYIASAWYGEDEHAIGKYAIFRCHEDFVQNRRGKIRAFPLSLSLSHSVNYVNKYLFIQQAKSYYRGLLFPLCSTGFLNSIIFGVYGNSFRIYQNMWVHTNRVNQTVWIPTVYNTHNSYYFGNISRTSSAESKQKYWFAHVFLGGCTAGVIKAICACPIELSKVRLQVKVSKLAVIRHAMSIINPLNVRFLNNFSFSQLMQLPTVWLQTMKLDHWWCFDGFNEPKGFLVFFEGLNRCCGGKYYLSISNIFAYNHRKISLLQWKEQ